MGMGMGTGRDAGGEMWREQAKREAEDGDRRDLRPQAIVVVVVDVPSSCK